MRCIVLMFLLCISFPCMAASPQMITNDDLERKYGKVSGSDSAPLVDLEKQHDENIKALNNFECTQLQNAQKNSF